MNQKEVSELRRRLAPDKNSIPKLYGCYVNSAKDIVSYIDENLGFLPEEETEKYMALLKKSLSGSLGRNLIDIVFSNEQVIDSDEHRLLSALRESALKDAEVREQFYHKVIESLDMQDQSYIILLACDTYDVPARTKDDLEMDDASDTVFTYIVCSICPVKDGKSELGYFSDENEFRTFATHQIVTPPALGFLFPAFDDRASNIYNALFYTKDPNDLHQDFIDAIFHTEPPMSAGEQHDTFRSVLAETLEDDCSFDVIQTVHEQLCERITQHKESKDPEPLAISASDVGEMLRNSGVSAETVTTFHEKCEEEFGQSAALKPSNLINSAKFEVVTPQVKISVDPSHSYMVETRVINGRKYILIPADEGVEINGLNVHLPQAEAETAETADKADEPPFPM